MTVTPTQPEGTVAPAGSTPDQDLFARQDKMFTERFDKPAGEPVVPPVVDTPAPDRAAELLGKSKAITDKIAGEVKDNGEPKKTEDPAAGSTPTKADNSDTPGETPFVDLSQFITTGDQKVDDSGAGVVPPEPEPDIDKETNIGNLRKVTGRFKAERDEFKTQLAEAQEKLKAQPDSTALQGQIVKLQDRVKELEPLQLVLDLHNHPEYKQRYVEAPKAVAAEMTQIFKDYGISEELVTDVLATDNRKELDELLAEQFPSESASGARQDVKMLKQKFDGLIKEKQEFEKKPKEFLSTLDARRTEEEIEITQKRNTLFERTVNESWSNVVARVVDVPAEEKIYELVEMPGKTEHNEKVARPTLNAARNMFATGTQYIESAIRNRSTLDPKFVEWFASICQQAAATRMINHSRMGLWAEHNKVLKEMNKQRGFQRPGVDGGPAGGGGSSGNNGKMDGKGIAAHIFKETMEQFDQK